MAKPRKGLSSAVNALILIIAVTIIALVTVGYVFGLFGAYAGMPRVTQVGTGYMIGDILIPNSVNPPSSYPDKPQVYVAVLTLQSTGRVDIVGASISGTPLIANSTMIEGVNLYPGNNLVVIVFPILNNYQLSENSTYTISIGLSDGLSVIASVEYNGVRIPEYDKNSGGFSYSWGWMWLWDNESEPVNITGLGFLGSSVYINSSNIIVFNLGHGKTTLVPGELQEVYYNIVTNKPMPFQQRHGYDVVLFLSNGEILIITAYPFLGYIGPPPY